MNEKLEFWAFLALMGGLLFITLSLTLLSGIGTTVGSVIVVLFLVSAGLYGLSIKNYWCYL
jgi:hypothetical protein